jgi:hypothetical protein
VEIHAASYADVVRDRAKPNELRSWCVAAAKSAQGAEERHLESVFSLFPASAELEDAIAEKTLRMPLEERATGPRVHVGRCPVGGKTVTLGLNRRHDLPTGWGEPLPVRLRET